MTLLLDTGNMRLALGTAHKGSVYCGIFNYDQTLTVILQFELQKIVAKCP